MVGSEQPRGVWCEPSRDLSLQRSRFILDADVTCGVNPAALRRLLILHGVVHNHRGPALRCLWKRISSASVAITRFVLFFILIFFAGRCLPERAAGCACEPCQARGCAAMERFASVRHLRGGKLLLVS